MLDWIAQKPVRFEPTHFTESTVECYNTLPLNLNKPDTSSVKDPNMENSKENNESVTDVEALLYVAPKSFSHSVFQQIS